MHGSIPPPDDAAHADSVLTAEVAAVNTQLGRYVLRLLDAYAGRAESISIDEERALSERVTRVADRLRDRAERRELNDRRVLPVEPALQLTDWGRSR
jgi:hypothetical protein